MTVGVVEAIYKLKYSVFFTGKKLRTQGKHREFCLDGSVVTLFKDLYVTWMIHL